MGLGKENVRLCANFSFHTINSSVHKDAAGADIYKKVLIANFCIDLADDSVSHQYNLRRQPI